MDSMNSPPATEGPRFATLLEQMAHWFAEQVAKHPPNPTTTIERRVPPQER